MVRISRGFPLVLTVLIVLGTCAGLYGAARRWRVEARNRRVEIGLEWDEVNRLAQLSQTLLDSVMEDFHANGATTLIVPEDTIAGLEQLGVLTPTRVALPTGGIRTDIATDTTRTFLRIANSFRTRGIHVYMDVPDATLAGKVGTRFRSPGAEDSSGQTAHSFFVQIDYALLRSAGAGLNPDGMAAAKKHHFLIAGRIGNFPGVTPYTAASVLNNLRKQGVSTVIFSGDDALGYRGLEKETAALFRDPSSLPRTPLEKKIVPSGLTYGQVEFGKQHGDEEISSALHGDYVRVHSIQIAEMGQMKQEEIVDRFIKAARERNIRFLYVRLVTSVGPGPLQSNVAFIQNIAHGILQGKFLTGGGMDWGPAKRFGETGVGRGVFVLVALGVAAGIVWLLRVLSPAPDRIQRLLFLSSVILCVGLAVGAGETGRKVVALLAGIVFPAIACLKTFPRDSVAGGENRTGSVIPRSVQALALASAITAIGIVHVVGLLATRPFMMHANQFLGIKVQHAIPILLLALIAVAGGTSVPGETWKQFQARVAERFRMAMDEPARFGLLLAGIGALVVLVFIVARTGNDSGVGVSGTELEGRSLLDRLLVVRPRSKEFLLGHPAFILGVCWWWRGRRRLAIPAFIVGSIGQVSLLNTFCHIHTPLIISLWRDLTGLVIGGLIGIALYRLLELVLPPPQEDEAVASGATLGLQAREQSVG